MRLLSRYILAELLKVFLVTLLGMTMVILLAGIAQEAVRQGLGLLPILRLVPYFLPNALVYAVPGTILFAVCSVYGRMSADNEIVAAKSVGISPMAFLTPGLILAFLVSLTAVWLNDVAASWGQRGVDRVVLQSVEQIAYGLLRTHRVYSTNRFSINIVNIEGRKLIHPTLTFHASEDSPPFTLIAEEAELRLNADKSALSILLTNSEFDWGEKWGGDIPGVAVQEIPLTAASRKGGPSINHANSTMQEIPQRIGDQIEEMQQMRQQFAAEAAYEMLTGDFGAITGPKWSGYQLQLRDAQTQLYRLQLVPWRRWANGFSCLFFVMVGAPLAIRLRNADIWTSFGAVLPADPAAVLPAAHVRAGSRQMRSLAPLQYLDGQSRIAVRRRLVDLPSIATLIAVSLFVYFLLFLLLLLRPCRLWYTPADLGRLPAEPDTAHGMRKHSPPRVRAWTSLGSAAGVATRRSPVLSHWPIRYKLLFGTTLLCLIVATLSFSSFQGVYAYRQLVRGISRRAAELEPASNLTAKVGELRFTLRQVQSRPGFPGQPRSDMGVMREHFEANLIAVKSALQGYQDALEGSNAEDPFIGDKRREYESVQQIRHCLDRITELKSENDWVLEPVVSDELDEELERLAELSGELPKFLRDKMRAFRDEVRGQYHTWIFLTWTATVLTGLGLLVARAPVLRLDFPADADLDCGLTLRGGRELRAPDPARHA